MNPPPPLRQMTRSEQLYYFDTYLKVRCLDYLRQRHYNGPTPDLREMVSGETIEELEVAAQSACEQILQLTPER